MNTKVEKVCVADFNKEDECVQCVGVLEPGGAAAGQGGRTTSHTTPPRRPTGVVVLSSCVVRVPPKKVQLFIEKPRSFCGLTWKKAKAIGTFGFDKQPREDRLHVPVWTSRRSTLDLNRVLRHRDYTNVRITVHLRGGRPAHFSTTMDWIINHVTADQFVLRLNGKYMDTPKEMAAVAVTAKTPQCQEKVAVDDHVGKMETEDETLDVVTEEIENKDEGVRSDSDTDEAEEEKVVVNKEEEEERWRNVVVVGGPCKGGEYQGVGRMGRPDTASSTGQVLDTVITNVRRVVAAIMVLCLVAVLVDAWWDEDHLA